MGRFDSGSDRRARRYKVTYFGENIGAFLLPVGGHMENPDAPVRPVVTKPYREGEGVDALYFWAEMDPDGGYYTVSWRPEAAAESEEAERFYNTAHGLNADGALNSELQPPLAARTVEETRLIRAVRERPDEDQPYLDYADWLARNGDPYAEYIELALRMRPLAEGDKFYERLDDRCDDLIDRYGAGWVRGLTELGLFPGSDDRDADSFDPGLWFGEKGVVDYLDVPDGSLVFRTNPARLFAAAPFLSHLNVSDPAVTVAHLAAVPQMAQLGWLYLDGGSGTEDEFRRFAESPYFSGLWSLTLHCYGVGSAGAAAIAGAKWMSSLRELCLDLSGIGDAGVFALAESPACANLVELQLNGNDLSDRGLIALCRSPHLAKLQTLELGTGAFTAEGMSALGSATFAPTLRYLDLAHCGLDGAALDALAAGTFPALRVANLIGNAVGDAVMQAIIAAPYFRTLEAFWAGACDLGNGIVKAIASAGPIALEDLGLNDNRINADGVAVLVRSKAATTIKYLDLARNPIGPDGVLALAAADLPALRELNIAGTRLGKDEVRALVRAPWRKQLTNFHITEDDVGERGRDLLIERFGEDVVDFDEEE